METKECVKETWFNKRQLIIITTLSILTNQRRIYKQMQITEAIKDKTLVITGGTGSFGSTVHKHFLTSEIGEN